MDTEQSSDSEILSRLTALDSPAPKAPEPAVEPSVPQAAESEEPAPQAEETEPADDSWTDFTDDDGEVIPVHKKVAERVKRWDEFTKVKQEVETARIQADDRMRFAEAREQLMTAVMQEATELKVLEASRQQLDGIDWGAVFQADQAQYFQLQNRKTELDKQIGEKRAQIQGKANHIQNAVQQHNATQWKLAEQGAYQRIGKISEQENQALANQVVSLGFSVEELKSRFADPRIIHALYKAAKYDEFQASKPSALTSVKSAPPVLKPGASKGPGVAAEEKYKQARAAQKKSGSLQDTARLFMLRG